MNFKKSTILLLLLTTSVLTATLGQDSLKVNKWFIGLPLRFTSLQSKPTMLSGIKVGREINKKMTIYLSIYHSFYLKSFRSSVHVSGLIDEPRIFINGMGSEIEYFIFKRQKISFSGQLLLGWGFMKYDLKSNNFQSKQVNYFLLEPTLNFETCIAENNFLGIGFGYRPILNKSSITFESDVINGELPIFKNFPNGINIILTFKGAF